VIESVSDEEDVLGELPDAPDGRGFEAPELRLRQSGTLSSFTRGLKAVMAARPK